MAKTIKMKKNENKTKSVSIRITEQKYLEVVKRIYSLDNCDGITDYVETLIDEDLKNAKFKY